MTFMNERARYRASFANTNAFSMQAGQKLLWVTCKLENTYFVGTANIQLEQIAALCECRQRVARPLDHSQEAWNLDFYAQYPKV